jgi:hypothetical protein
MSKAKWPEFARVYSVQNMAVPLERKVVFHRTVQNIDECLVEIAQKMTWPLEVIGVAEEKYPSKKVLGFFCEAFAKNRSSQIPRRNMEHLARPRGKHSKTNISRISPCLWAPINTRHSRVKIIFSQKSSIKMPNASKIIAWKLDDLMKSPLWPRKNTLDKKR